jgi:hypothetical protein
MITIGINSIAAAINIRLFVPKLSTKKIGIVGPTIAPVLAPVAMIPNRRGAWFYENRTDKKLQNTET